LRRRRQQQRRERGERRREWQVRHYFWTLVMPTCYISLDACIKFMEDYGGLADVTVGAALPGSLDLA
jgi:hypothetical protein